MVSDRLSDICMCLGQSAGPMSKAVNNKRAREGQRVEERANYATHAKFKQTKYATVKALLEDTYNPLCQKQNSRDFNRHII